MFVDNRGTSDLEGIHESVGFSTPSERYCTFDQTAACRADTSEGFI